MQTDKNFIRAIESKSEAKKENSVLRNGLFIPYSFQ